jgi:ribosomal protein S18 acetylase RimI-like enzyme
MSEVKVRAARVADESLLLALVEEEMRAHEELDPRLRLRKDAADRYAVYLRGRMRDIDSSVFVAVHDDEVVGLAIGSIRKQDGFFVTQRYGYLSDVMVAPALRRRGIGRALYERVVLWFQGLGIDVVRLHVATRSDEARSFWHRIGAEDFMAEAWIDLKKSGPGEAAKDVLEAGESTSLEIGDLPVSDSGPSGVSTGEPFSFEAGGW